MFTLCSLANAFFARIALDVNITIFVVEIERSSVDSVAIWRPARYCFPTGVCVFETQLFGSLFALVD